MFNFFPCRVFEGFKTYAFCGCQFDTMFRIKLLSLFSKWESNFSYCGEERSCFRWDVSNNTKLYRAPCFITLRFFVRSSSISGCRTSMAKWLRAAALESSGRKSSRHNGNTGCPYFTLALCTTFSFNAPCQFTPLLYSRPSGFRCIALWLAAHEDAAYLVRNWRHRTKPREWTITRSRESSQLTCGRHVVRPRITV